MDLTLPADLERFIYRKVREGKFQSAGEAVTEALREWEQRERLAASATAPHRLAPLRDFANGDIEALVFVTMMEAAKSAEEDLKAIMAEVKAINASKRALRQIMARVRRDVTANLGRRGGQPLDFSAGLGSERAYHELPMPFPAPDVAGGVRFVRTDLFPRRLERAEDLDTILDEIKNKLDSMSEMGEMESLRLQMAMDRLSKMMSTLSNLLKKISDTSQSIVQNLK